MKKPETKTVPWTEIEKGSLVSHNGTVYKAGEYSVLPVVENKLSKHHRFYKYDNPKLKELWFSRLLHILNRCTKKIMLLIANLFISVLLKLIC